MEMMALEGQKTICYWYKKGEDWYFFTGLYADGELITAYVDFAEVEPIVLWIMDEPVPNHNLSIWNEHLSAEQAQIVGKQNDLMRLPFSDKLTHWYKL
jgi:hypothetical protein